LPEQGRQEQAGFTPPRTTTSPPSWRSGGQSDRAFSFSSAFGGRSGWQEILDQRAQSAATSVMEKAAKNLLRISLDGLEGGSQEWPKFTGKVLAYAVWKKEWQRHHLDKYVDLKADSLKRIMLERCLPEEVKERVQFKRTIEDIWKYLDIAYNRPDVFLHDLMAPVNAARTISDGNWRGLEAHMDFLRRTFEHADDSGMTPVVLHYNNLKVMYGRWPAGDQTRWWVKAAGLSPMEQPEALRRFVESRYDVVAMLASQRAISGGGGGGRRESNQKKEEKSKQKWAKQAPGRAVVNAAPVTVPATQPAPMGLRAAGRPLMPCRLAAIGCKENHQLEYYGMFKG